MKSDGVYGLDPGLYIRPAGGASWVSPSVHEKGRDPALGLVRISCGHRNQVHSGSNNGIVAHATLCAQMDDQVVNLGSHRTFSEALTKTARVYAPLQNRRAVRGSSACALLQQGAIHLGRCALSDLICRRSLKALSLTPI